MDCKAMQPKLHRGRYDECIPTRLRVIVHQASPTLAETQAAKTPKLGYDPPRR